MTQDQFNQAEGGSFIVLVFSLLLYGIAILQAYLYFPHNTTDSTFTQSMVALLVVLGSIHSFLACHAMYNFLIPGYTDPLIQIGGIWSLYSAHVFSEAAIIIVQLFFIGTVYKFVVNRPTRLVLITLLTLLSGGQIAYAILVVFKSWHADTLLALPGLVPHYFLPLAVIRAVSDFITMVALCVSLYDSRSTFGKVLRLVRVPIIYAINGFVLTTVVTIVQASIFIANNQIVSAIVIEWISVHLYINSFMATLNAKFYFLNDERSQNYVESAPQRMTFATNPRPLPENNGKKVRMSLEEVRVAIGKETVIMSDVDPQAVHRA